MEIKQIINRVVDETIKKDYQGISHLRDRLLGHERKQMFKDRLQKELWLLYKSSKGKKIGLNTKKFEDCVVSMTKLWCELILKPKIEKEPALVDVNGNPLVL